LEDSGIRFARWSIGLLAVGLIWAGLLYSSVSSVASLDQGLGGKGWTIVFISIVPYLVTGLIAGVVSLVTRRPRWALYAWIGLLLAAYAWITVCSVRLTYPF
jgi:hypothetical protein